MKPEELTHIKIDSRYLFHLTDGRELVRRGSWLLGTKDGHWAIDPHKCELVASVTPIGEDAMRLMEAQRKLDENAPKDPTKPRAL